MKKLILITSIVFASTILWQGCTKSEETGTLYGGVTDIITGEPIIEADIELSPIGYKTKTGSDGWYRFTDVEMGEYEVLVTKRGYSFVKEKVSMQKKSVNCNVQIESVPTFQYDGNSYMVAPNGDYLMILSYAHYGYCQDLTIYGYSDWRLPTIEELQQMYIDKNAIGGFFQDYGYWSITYSRTISSGDLYYYILFSNGNMEEALPSTYLRVRPIRIDN